MPAALLTETLDALKVGDARRHRNLSLFPLFLNGGRSARQSGSRSRFDLLEQAIAAGTAAVKEVSASGSVPELKVVNSGKRPVLIPEGEIVVGGKQNRTVNVTVIVAPESDYVLPVTCVEAGRWGEEAEFTTQHYAPPQLRSKKVRSMQSSMRESGQAKADQSEVWEEVSSVLGELEAVSKTSSLADGFASSEEKLAEYGKALDLPEGASGFVVMSGETAIGMDLFDSPETLAAIWPRLSRAYFLQDVAKEQAEGEAPSSDAVERFLREVDEAAEEPADPEQAHVHIDIASESHVGTATYFERELCHVAVFPKPPDRAPSAGQPGVQQMQFAIDPEFMPECAVEEDEGPPLSEAPALPDERHRDENDDESEPEQ